MKDQKKQFSLFNIFSPYRDGKGVDKDEITGPPNLKNFFKSYFRKFSKLLSVNLAMLFQIPTLFLLLFYASSMLASGTGDLFSVFYSVIVSALGIPMTVNTSHMFAPVYGMYIASGSESPSLLQLLNVFGGTIDLPTYSTLYYVVFGVLILFSLATWGFQNIGSTYLTRNMVRGEPVFVISDYFYAIKKNWRQGLIFGIVDFILIFVLVTDVLYFLTNSDVSFVNDLMMFISIGLSIIYLVIRRYVYLMLITFDIKIWKAFKNGFIFSTLGLKRNAMAALGKVLILALNIVMTILLLPYGIALPLILPLIYYFATSAYISVYAHYPVIAKYMIEPYESESNEEDTELIAE